MVDVNERSASITVNGEEYELILTTKATKELAARYGGLENLGNKLMQSEKFEEVLEEIVWMIVLLANQSIMIHNMKNPKGKKELLTEEKLELLTSPMDLANFKDAIMQAMTKGTKRNIESEETEPKNGQTG
ncbi:MAG: hypothetical protein ACLSSW_01085 [Acutalibacteraceae bacterium]